MKTLLRQTLIAAALGTAMAASAQYTNPPSSPPANPSPSQTTSPSYGTDNSASNHDHYWVCLFVVGSANQDACIAREKAKSGGGKAMTDSKAGSEGNSSSGNSTSTGMGTSGATTGGTSATGGTSSGDAGGAGKQ
jgi:hypothetical protein